MTDRQAYYKKWKEENRERLNEYSRAYGKRNRTKIAAWRKKRRIKQWDKIRGQEKKSREKSERSFLLRKLDNLKRGKRRGKTMGFDIDIDFILDLWQKQEGKCAITGYDMKHELNNPYSVSIDRIDSSKGYFRDNTQLVCQSINFAKNSWSNESMLEFWLGVPNRNPRPSLA